MVAHTVIPSILVEAEGKEFKLEVAGDRLSHFIQLGSRQNTILAIISISFFFFSFLLKQVFSPCKGEAQNLGNLFNSINII